MLRLHFLQFALCLLSARNRLAIHGQDDVTGAQVPRSRPILVDIRDDSSRLPGRQAQPPRQLRRHILERQSEAGGAVLLRLLLILFLVAPVPAVGLLLGLEIQLFDRHVKRLFLFVPQDLDWY